MYYDNKHLILFECTVPNWNGLYYYIPWCAATEVMYVVKFVATVSNYIFSPKMGLHSRKYNINSNMDYKVKKKKRSFTD